MRRNDIAKSFILVLMLASLGSGQQSSKAFSSPKVFLIVGQGLMDNDNAYVTAIGFVGKVSLESGAYLWRRKGLYRQSSSAFNSFAVPELEGNTVVFRESQHYLRKKVAVLRVDRKTGKIISIQV